MTTITIARAVLYRALSALEFHTQQTRPIHNTELVIEELRAALAAQPTGPAWHDAPNAPGDWAVFGSGFKYELQTGITQREIDMVSNWPGRWFGPIPPDSGETK